MLLGYLLLAVIVATCAAWLADRHGRSFWVWFVFTAVFPFTVVITVPYLLLFTRRANASD